MRRPQLHSSSSSSSSSLVTIFSLVLVTLSLASFSSIHVHAQSFDCTQLDTVTLRALNGTNGTQINNQTVQGLLIDPVTSPVFTNIPFSTNVAALSSFIGRAYGCNTSGSTFYELNLRLNNTQYINFTQHIQIAVATTGLTNPSSVLSPYFASFTRGAASPICNATDCPLAPTTPPTTPVPTTATPTTPAPTASVNTTNAPNTTAPPTTQAPTTAAPTATVNTTNAPNTTVAPTTAAPTTNVTAAPTSTPTPTSAPTNVTATTVPPTTTTAPTTPIPTTSAPTTAAPTSAPTFPPQRCFNVTHLEDRNTSHTYTIVTDVTKLENVTEPVFVDVIQLEPYFVNDTIVRNHTFSNWTLVPRIETRNQTLYNVTYMNSTVGNVSTPVVVSNTSYVQIQDVIVGYDNVTTIIGWELRNDTELVSRTRNTTVQQQQFTYLNQTTWHFVNRTFVENVTTPVINTTITIVPRLINTTIGNVSTLVQATTNSTATRPFHIILNQTSIEPNQTVIGSLIVNVTLFNITYTTVTVGNITQINVTGTELYTQFFNLTDTITTVQITNTTKLDNVTRLVNETDFTLIPIPVTQTILKNVTKPVTSTITNYTMVPTLVDTPVCVNQSCFLEYYNEFRPQVEIQVTPVSRVREVSVIDLQPQFAPVTTLQSTSVTVYTLNNVTRNFTILQETIVYDYANVTIYNTSIISTPYERLENVTTIHYNTSITTHIVNDTVQTGYNNRSQTYNITTYTSITRLQNVTRIETRPAVRNVTVTRFNVTTVNASVSVPTTVLIATTVLCNVTYLENVTKPENVSVPFQNVTGYNNVTVYGLANWTDFNVNHTFPNGTWVIMNVTHTNDNTSIGWKLEPVYSNTTTYIMDNRTHEENVTKAFNITTFTPTIVNVREFRLINVTNTFNETVLQNITVPFPVTRLENVTVQAPTGFMIVTNYTLEPVFSQVPRIVTNTTLIPYNVTQLENVTHYNITTVNTSTTAWTIIGQRSIFTPVVVQREVTELVSQTITVQTPQTAQVVVGYTPIITTTTTSVLEQNFTAVVTQVPYNVSRIVCNDIPTTPPPTTAPPTTPAPTTPPPNVTISICSIEDVPVYVNVSTPRWELVNTTFTNNYTVQVIRPVNTTFPNTTTIVELKNVTRLVNGTISQTKYELRNTSVLANNTIVTPIFGFVNESTTNYTSQLTNLTRYVNHTVNATIGYTNITTPIIIPTSVVVSVTRTYRVPVITNVSTTINVTYLDNRTTIEQEPVFTNVSVPYNDTELVSEDYIENVVSHFINITYSMVNTSSSTPIYNGTTTQLVTQFNLKNVTRPRNVTIMNGTRVVPTNVTELVPITRPTNVTVPQQTIFVPITIPVSWHIDNVTYPNGTVATVNITSEPVIVSVPVVIPEFITVQNVTKLENQTFTRNIIEPVYVTVVRNTSEWENVSELVNVTTPIQIGTNITWSMVNTSHIDNITVITPTNRTHLVSKLVLRERIDLVQNGTRSVNKTQLVEVLNGTITTWELITTFKNVNETVNVSTTVNVPAGNRVDYQPIVAPVERVEPEWYLDNVTVPVTTYSMVNRTIGTNTTVTFFNRTELRNTSFVVEVPITFNQTKLENVTTVLSFPYWAFINQTFNDTRVNTTWAWVNHTSIVQVPTISRYIPTTVCRNFTGLPGTILYSSGVAVNPTDAFCTKLAGSNNATRQWIAVKNIMLWSFQGINVTGFSSVNFPGWRNHPAIAPYFRGQFIYDPPYTSPFAGGQEFNIDFTSSLYVDEYATLIEHFVQYFGASWGCIGQKGDRFPGYQGNPRMDVIHGGMAINYATYRIFYNQLVRALIARGTSSQDINEFIVPYFENGPFLRGGALAICTQPDCPCAPGTNLCSGQCLPRCPVLPTDPICIKVTKLNTPFGLTDTNSSFAALQSVMTLAFRGSQGVVQNGVAVAGLLAPDSTTAPLYNMNGGRNLSSPESSTLLNNLVSNYVRFLGPLLGCNSNPLDGNFSVYQGRPIGSVHAPLNINLATYTYWFTQVELALRFYGVPQADINSIHPGFFNTFTRGSPVAICTAPDCPCAIGYVANGTECSLATTAPPPTSPPTKGQPTLVPTLPPATPPPSSNVTQPPSTTTATPTTASPTTPTSTPTTPAPTTNPNGTTAPPTTPPTLTPGGTASTIQVSIMALFTLAVATVMAMQL